MVDEGGSLTDNEDTHDHHQYDGDVLLIPALTHLSSPSLAALQRLDQFDVEEGDEQQRAAVDDDEVQDVGVDDAVETIAAERADLEHVARLVDSDAYLYAFVLEESPANTPPSWELVTTGRKTGHGSEINANTDSCSSHAFSRTFLSVQHNWPYKQCTSQNSASHSVEVSV